MPERLTRRALLTWMGAGGAITIIGGCSQPSETPSLPPSADAPPASQNSAPAERTARAFLEGWSDGDFNAMYQWLTPGAQTQIALGDFVEFYQSIQREVTVLAARPAKHVIIQSAQLRGTSPAILVSCRAKS